MPSASDEIRAAIAAAVPMDGVRAIPFEQFMERALYGASGFYQAGGGAGRRGDFITSPEVGPLFGAVLSRALDACWRDLGEPGEFTVVDAGAGPGTLARSVRAAAPACMDALRYVAIEISADQRDRHPDWVTSLSGLDEFGAAGVAPDVILANELLDNLPFRLFVMDGGWREAFVVSRHDGTFAEVLRAAPDLDVLGLPASATHGARVPVHQRTQRWLLQARAHINRGRLIVIDYTSPTTAVMAGRPWREWLRTYRAHERGQHYLRDPGGQDITAEVAIDQLVAVLGEPTAAWSQRQFLEHWGIAELVAEGRRVWAEEATRPGVRAMTMRSREREAEALLADPGLGAFSVLEWSMQ